MSTDNPRPSRRKAAARRRRRPEGKPGPLPIVARSFQVTKGTWKSDSQPALVLSALRAGATWDLAAKVARLNQATPRDWNARGAEIAQQLDATGLELDESEPTETHAYLAFHRAAEEARATPVVNALMTIDRATRTGNVTAAEIVLKRHPDAKPYRPDTRLELSGPDGGAIPLSVKDEVRSKLEAMAERLAENAKPASADGPEQVDKAPNTPTTDPDGDQPA